MASLPRADAAPAMPLVGRGAQLRRLLGCLEGARAGDPGAVLVHGAAGAGKTRLLREALVRGEQLGYRVLLGRADELDRAVPYALLRSALGEALTAEADPELTELTAAVSAALEPWTEGVPGEEAPRFADGTLERLLHAWSERVPIVLVLEDLHAADDDTLGVVSRLIRRLGGTRCAVLATMRSHATDVGTTLRASVEQLSRDGLLDLVDLPPLDEDGAVALAADLLGAAPDEPLAGTLWDACRGNPFYVLEAVRSYREQGALQIIDGRCRLVPDAAPVTVEARGALLVRLDRLGRDPAPVARVLSVFKPLRLDLLDLVGQLTGLDPERVENAFDTLVRGDFLCVGARATFEFSHPIVRETLADSLGPAQRRRTHAALAARLASDRAAGRPVSVFDLAAHVASSASPGDRDAVEVLTEAARTSDRNAPASAAAWYARALALVPETSPEQARLVADRMSALYFAGCATEAVEAAEALHLAPDVEPGLLLRADMVAVGALIALGRLDEALSAAETALSRSPDAPPRLLAQRAALLVHLGRLDEAEAQARRGLDRAGHDGPARAPCLGQLAAVSHARGDAASCRDLLERQEEAAATAPVGLQLAAAATRATYFALQGHLADARRALDRTEALRHASGIGASRDATNLASLLVAWSGGDWDGALDLAGTLVDDPEHSGQLFSLAAIRAVKAAVLAERGHYGQARVTLDDQPDHLVGTQLVAWAASGIDAALGDAEAARRRLDEARVLAEDRGQRSGLTLLLSRLAEIEWSQGRADAALTRLEPLDDLAGTGAPLAQLLAWRTRGLVTADVDATRAAVRVGDDAGLVFDASRARLQLGEQVAGNEAAGHLTAAYETFRDLGAEPWRRRAAATLRAQGLPTPRRRAARAGALTGNEVELARLVSEGLTNRQIARVLFLSPKTIEAYLSRLYARTGCNSRVQLAAALSSGRLVGLDLHASPGDHSLTSPARG
jgi:DNA-binding CsgD family transcriptional regulator